ncbi:MAG: C4-type zinc ribbon domain-containing protein [Kiritimatiellae bacterium]|nr:C4-type zinc ribbon domain-containing protein [Kiritimatiellia bacterium]MDW8458974.1 C4-type zinc ribbon domain-containing protein [Verrucomicrobiota bacterium]
MLTSIEQLLVLQDRDRRIKQLKREIEDIPARKKLHEKALQEHKAALNAAHEALKKNAAAIKAIDLEIESLRQKIGKLRAQQNTVRTNEEYRALDREIAATEKAIRDEEDREIQLMEETEGLRANLALIEQKYKSEAAVFESEARALDQRLANLRAELERAAAERSELAKQVDPAWLSRYERVLNHTGDFAVVPVDRGSCGGCHMQLPPQSVHDAKRGTVMTSCSYCGRLLYWRG